MSKIDFDDQEMAIVHEIAQQIAEFHEASIKEAIFASRNGNFKPALRFDQFLRVMGLEAASLLFQTLQAKR